jgi:acetyl esterase/lipase
MALSELDKVEATAQLLRAQEEQERQDTAERQADADRLRAQLGGGRRSSSSSSSSSKVDEAAAEGEAAGGNSPFTNPFAGAAGASGGGFPFPEPELPDFLDLKTLGLMGRWEEVGGNFLLRPPDHATNPPKAVLHFLGGAFVGAAPHLTYRYLLTGLAEKGFLVVATPYNLSFDYVLTCDMVLERFEKVAIPLAKEYGALPVVGIGHSCGALLHVLITCLFPDTPRLANALISFNNQKAQKAIPAFEELVVPLSVSLMGDDGLLGGSPVLAADGGALGPGTALRQSLGRLRQNVEEVVEAYSASRLAPSVVRNEVVPLMKQVFSVVDQLPPLLQSISDGAREFAPTPDDTREVCRRMYRARRTLLVQFENDSIDESENLMKVLQESRSIMRMKRPLVKMDVRLETIKGTHITPLTQDIFRDPPAVVDVLNPLGPPVRRYAQEQFLATVRSVQALLVEWLEEGLAR